MIRFTRLWDSFKGNGQHVVTSLPGQLFNFVLLNGVILNLLLLSFSYLLLRVGWLSRGILSNSLTLLGMYFLRGQQGTDSWGPMFEALRAKAAHLPVYDTVFFENHTKFQYPLASLLPLYALQQIGMTETGMLQLLNVTSWFAVWGTIAIACLILVRSAGASLPTVVQETESRSRLISAGIVAGLLFFPVTWPYNLGQIQIFLSFTFAAALYCWMSGRELASGFLIALMILIKPQCGLFLCWFALRKKWAPFLVCLTVWCVGSLASIMVFGWHDHMRYLEVLSFMSKRGEVFYYNLTVNGFLNRLLQNGDSLKYTIHSFPSFNRLVYVSTVLSSFLFVAMSLFYPLRSRAVGGVTDFSTVALSMTLASPIAWDHHYGILFAAFAYFAGQFRNLKHVTLLTVSYVLLSNSWSPLNVFANKPLLNVLQSLPFFGVLLLLLFMYLEMARARTGECPGCVARSTEIL